MLPPTAREDKEFREDPCESFILLAFFRFHGNFRIRKTGQSCVNGPV